MGKPLAELERLHRQALDEIDELRKRDRRKGRAIARAEDHLVELRARVAEAIDADEQGRAAKLREWIDEVVGRIAAKRDERHDLHDELDDVRRHEAALEARVERKQQRQRRRLDNIGCLDGCAMPNGWKLVLLDCRENGWTGKVNSGDRTPPNCDHCSNKSSQAELWAAAQAGTGAPANPPASFCPTCGGTHEYVNDGTAYPNEPTGKRGPWWWLGIDLTNGDQFLVVAARLGYKVRRPYMPREPWHVNLTENPERVLVRRDRV